MPDCLNASLSGCLMSDCLTACLSECLTTISLSGCLTASLLSHCLIDSLPHHYFTTLSHCRTASLPGSRHFESEAILGSVESSPRRSHRRRPRLRLRRVRDQLQRRGLQRQEEYRSAKGCRTLLSARDLSRQRSTGPMLLVAASYLYFLLLSKSLLPLYPCTLVVHLRSQPLLVNRSSASFSLE